MPDTVIDRMYQDFEDILKLLEEQGDLSLIATASENFRKVLLISAWSYFEHRIQEILLQYFDGASNSHSPTVTFIEKQAISHRVYTLFDFRSKNANPLFSQFGPEFSAFMREAILRSSDLKNAIHDFVHIGDERNKLVHGNFASLPLEMTAMEVYELYNSAVGFLETLPIKLLEFETR